MQAEATHLPPMHDTPQAPQLFGSAVKSTHVPLQHGLPGMVHDSPKVTLDTQTLAVHVACMQVTVGVWQSVDWLHATQLPSPLQTVPPSMQVVPSCVRLAWQHPRKHVSVEQVVDAGQSATVTHGLVEHPPDEDDAVLDDAVLVLDDAVLVLDDAVLVLDDAVLVLDDAVLVLDDAVLVLDDAVLDAPPVPQLQSLHAEPFGEHSWPPMQAAGPTQTRVENGEHSIAMAPPVPAIGLPTPHEASRTRTTVRVSRRRAVVMARAYTMQARGIAAAVAAAPFCILTAQNQPDDPLLLGVLTPVSLAIRRPGRLAGRASRVGLPRSPIQLASPIHPSRGRCRRARSPRPLGVAPASRHHLPTRPPLAHLARERAEHDRSPCAPSSPRGASSPRPATAST
jgi:hypothetical protein